MAKPKRKLTSAERAARKRRRRETEIIFVHGKQKPVKRLPTIEGMDVDEFIRRNADPIWLQQNEMWEYMEAAMVGGAAADVGLPSEPAEFAGDDDFPFGAIGNEIDDGIAFEAGENNADTGVPPGAARTEADGATGYSDGVGRISRPPPADTAGGDG